MAVAVRNSSTNLDATTTAIVNRPASTSPGDIVVIGIACVAGATITTPVGFTLLDSTANGVDIRLSTYWKIATAEAATWTASLSISEYWSTFAVTLNGHDPTTPIDVHAIAVGTTSSVACPSITTTQDNDMKIAIGARYGISSTSWTYPGGFTGLGQTTLWYATIAGANALQAAAGASGTAVFTASAAGTAKTWCGSQIAIRETAAAAGTTPYTFNLLGVGA